MSERDVQAARDELQRRARGMLMQAFGYRYAQGVTMASLAERLGKPERWARIRIFGNVKITLRDLSDIARALEFRVEFRLEPIEPEEAVPTPPREEPR